MLIKNISKIYKIWIKKCRIKCDLNVLSWQKEWNIGNNFSMKSEMFFIDYFRVVKVKLAQNSQVFSRYETLAALSYQIRCNLISVSNKLPYINPSRSCQVAMLSLCKPLVASQLRKRHKIKQKEFIFIYIKSTKNWYTIDALGAIYTIFIILDTLQYFYNNFTIL